MALGKIGPGIGSPTHKGGGINYRSCEDPLKSLVCLLCRTQPDLGVSSCLKVKPLLVLAQGTVGAPHAKLLAQEATGTQCRSGAGSGREAERQSEF